MRPIFVPRKATTHIKLITHEFGKVPLPAVRPSSVKSWVAKLKTEGREPSYALHSRLSQIMSDAVHEGLIVRNLCSRRTAPPMGKQKPYVATLQQVWAVHDQFRKHQQVALLLGAFAGLRVAEVSALKVADIDLMRGVVNPKQQWKDESLKPT